MLAYRSSVQESTQFTPYRLMFGREVQLPIELMFHLKPCHLQENHQPETPLPVTEIVPPLGHSNEVAPQSEHLEGEEEPWAYYQPESSLLVETDEQLESSESTFHAQDESQHDNQQTITPPPESARGGPVWGPDCAKKFNPQTITSLSPGRAPAPKGGSNVMNTTDLSH